VANLPSFDLKKIRERLSAVTSRQWAIVGGSLATVVVLLVGGLVLFGGSDEEPEAATTVATTTPAAEATTTTAAETTTSEQTTTTERTVEAAATYTVAIEGSFDSTEPAHEALRAFYAWIGDPAFDPPEMAEGLTEYLADVEPAGDLALDAQFASAELPGFAEGTEVAVARADEDVVLLVKEEGTDWRVVGAKLPSIGKAVPWFGPELRFVMIIGTDARPGQAQEVYRGDSLHILSSNVAENAGAIVGLPRDSYVEAPYGFDKYTNVNALAGPATTTDIARALSGAPLEGYIVTGFKGFTELVDNMGGIPVDVPFAMAEPKSQAYLSAGLQWLLGADTLAFSRNRTLPGGDFTRSFHHGIVIQGALDAVQGQGILGLPGLLRILTTSAWTDLSIEELLTMAAGAYEIDPEQFTNQTLQGSVATRGGASVVLLYEEEAAATFADLVDDGIVTPPEADE
jgi:LCP family protein required for cell wall assembly